MKPLYVCMHIHGHHSVTVTLLRSRRDINREMVTAAAWSPGLMSHEAVALMLMNSDDLERSLN